MNSLEKILSILPSTTFALPPNAIAIIADDVYSPIPGKLNKICLLFGIIPL